jgi:hypothetical protein
MWKKFIVRINEKGILNRDGNFERILEPGRYRFLSFGGKPSVENYAQDSIMPDDAVVDHLLQHQAAEAEKHFIVMNLQDDETGLRFENGVLAEVLAPGTRRFIWKGLKEHRLERFDLGQGAELPAAVATRLNAANLKNHPVAGFEASWPRRFRPTTSACCASTGASPN